MKTLYATYTSKKKTATSTFALDQERTTFLKIATQVADAIRNAVAFQTSVPVEEVTSVSTTWNNQGREALKVVYTVAGETVGNLYIEEV